MYLEFTRMPGVTVGDSGLCCCTSVTYHVSVVFRSDPRSSKGSAPFLVLALSSGIGSHFLFVVLKPCRLSNLSENLFSVSFEV